MEWPRQRWDWTTSDRKRVFSYKHELPNTIIQVHKGNEDSLVSKIIKSDAEWHRDVLGQAFTTKDEPDEGGLALLLLPPVQDDSVPLEEQPDILQTIPMHENIFANLTSKFFIHSIIARSINRRVAKFLRVWVSMKESSSAALVLNARTTSGFPGDIAASITFLPLHKFTYALLYGMTSQMQEKVLGWLRYSDGTTIHPLLVAGMVAEMENERLKRRVEDGFCALSKMMGMFSAWNLKSQETQRRRQVKEKRAARKAIKDKKKESENEKKGLGKERKETNSSVGTATTNSVAQEGSTKQEFRKSIDPPTPDPKAAMADCNKIRHTKLALKDWETQLRKMIDLIYELETGVFAPLPRQPDLLSPLPSGHALVGEGSTQMLNIQKMEEEYKMHQRKAGRRIKERLEELVEESEAHVRKCDHALEGMNQATNLAHAEANMEVALAARRDNTQMKAIAFLTMVYLPPTFIATVFATDFFTWDNVPFSGNGTTSNTPNVTFNSSTIFILAPDEPDPPIVFKSIWAYFLFSAVLTFVTLALWVWYSVKRKAFMMPRIIKWAIKTSASGLRTAKGALGRRAKK